MGKKHVAGSICADASEVAIMEGRLNALIESRIEGDISKAVGECAVNIGIPCHSKSVYIEQSVSLGDFCFGRRFRMDFRIMGEEFGQVVFVNLFAKGVRRGDEHIF